MKPIVKNQHYIPESLLELFADSKGRLFEALFRGDEKMIFPTSKSKTMCANFIYEDDALKKNTIEDYFGKIEAREIPKIKNDLINAIKSFKQDSTNFGDIRLIIDELLPTFLLFYYRSGALLTEFSSINKSDKIPLLTNKIMDEVYLSSLARTIHLGYKMSLVESNQDLLISDQYVSTAALKIKSRFVNVSNRHIGLKETIIVIPLSPSCYIVYWHTDAPFFLKENSIHCLSQDETFQINRTVMNNSYQKCVGMNEESLKAVIGEYKMEYPSQVYMGYKSGYTTGAIRKKEVFFYDQDIQAFEIFQDPLETSKYFKIGPNDSCPCGSERKLKKCHREIFERIKDAIHLMNTDANARSRIVRIPNTPITELPIDEWGGYSEKLRQVRPRI